MNHLSKDQYATVGISRSQVDNRELVESWSYNLISEIDCVPPDAKNLDSDLTLGMISKNKYSKGKKQNQWYGTY